MATSTSYPRSLTASVDDTANTRPLAWLVPGTIALGCIAYVYRFPFVAGNLSLFRLAGLLVSLALLLRLLFSTREQAYTMLQRLLLPFCMASGITIVVLAEVAFRAPPPGYSADAVVQTLNVLILLMMVAYIDTRDVLVRVLRAYVLCSYVEAALAVTALITGRLAFSDLIVERGAEYYSDLQLVNESEGLRRLTGTFFDPNFYGVYLCTVVAFAAWLIMRGSRSRLVSWAIPISIVLIFLTASRTAMLGLCVLGGVVFFLAPRARRVVIAIGLTGLPVLIAYAYAVSESPLLERVLSGQSALDRLEFFTRGLSAFTQAPLIGGGTASLIDPVSGYATAHSVYLSVLGKFGLIGGMAFAAFIFGPIAVRTRDQQVVADRGLALLCVLPLAAMYLAYDFFQFLELQFVVYAIAYTAVLPVGRRRRSPRCESEHADLRG